MGMLGDYFNLGTQKARSGPVGTLESTGIEAGPAAADPPKHAPVYPQYLALVLGILAEPFIRQYINEAGFAFDAAAFGMRTIFAIIMGIVILPAVYKNSFDIEKPLLVQLAAIFTAGIGWKTLFEAGAS